MNECVSGCVYNAARELSKVGPLNGTSALSYSGFLTVSKTYNSNMFFWFFPSQVLNITALGSSVHVVIFVLSSLSH